MENTVQIFYWCWPESCYLYDIWQSSRESMRLFCIANFFPHQCNILRCTSYHGMKLSVSWYMIMPISLTDILDDAAYFFILSYHGQKWFGNYYGYSLWTQRVSLTFQALVVAHGIILTVGQYQVFCFSSNFLKQISTKPHINMIRF